MASDPFYSPKRTLARARHHIGDFEANITGFENGKYQSYVVERDAHGRPTRPKVKFDRDFFEQITCIAFDAANNLRSALDQAAFTAANLGGKLNPKKAYFPMGVDALGLENVIARKCGDLPAEIVSLFRGFKPYPRGNLYLPALNTLCNTQKHAHLIPFRGEDLTLVTQGVVWTLKHRWDPEKYEIEIVSPIEPLGFMKLQAKGAAKLAFEVTFSHPEAVLGGSKPLALLHGMAREVERVLMATEGECRRIGLVS
jgi:hypothetical protein